MSGVSPIRFSSVHYAWPDNAEEPVFTDLSIDLPDGLVFLVGPNGIGKSTLLLLAGARVFPQRGAVTILGTDAARFADAALDSALEEERNRLVSFVYQNMEFETEEPIGVLLEFVARSGAAPDRAEALLDEMVRAADLGDRLGARMQELSKGEMQRAIVVMSVLYGSPIILMDEPVFAVEPSRAERLVAELRRLASDGVTTYTSVHDVELARAHADAVVLFGEDGSVTAGDPGELLDRPRLEEAFRAPYDTLYERQRLYRGLLNESYS